MHTQTLYSGGYGRLFLILPNWLWIQKLLEFRSAFIGIPFGVPQGSYLRPLFYQQCVHIIITLNYILYHTRDICYILMIKKCTYEQFLLLINGCPVNNLYKYYTDYS